MADEEELLTTIDEYLLSIAEGIQLAQAELDRSAPTGAPYRYYLPHLDFELRMTIQMEERTTSGGAGTQPRRMLVLRPVSSTESTSNVQTISTVRGRFVAVPSGVTAGGLHARSLLTVTGPRRATVTVNLTDTTGAPQAGLDVHFNVDREVSQEASAERGVDVSLSAKTTFVAPVVRTNAAGEAVSVLTVAAEEPGGTVLALVIDAGGKTEIIYHQVPEGD